MSRLSCCVVLSVVGLLFAGCPDDKVKAEQQRVGGAPKTTIDTMKDKANAAVKKTENRLDANMKAADEAQ